MFKDVVGDLKCVKQCRIHFCLQDICVVRFIPGVNEEKAAYINLYSYLNSRSRCGVVEHKAKNIKDFYIVPLASHSKIPSVLLPFDGPGIWTFSAVYEIRL